VVHLLGCPDLWWNCDHSCFCAGYSPDCANQSSNEAILIPLRLVAQPSFGSRLLQSPHTPSRPLPHHEEKCSPQGTSISAPVSLQRSPAMRGVLHGPMKALRSIRGMIGRLQYNGIDAIVVACDQVQACHARRSLTDQHVQRDFYFAGYSLQ
jgi:hypothetical protein